MASPSETSSSVESRRFFPHFFGVRLLAALAAVLLLYLTNPTISLGLWAPAVGLGLVLVAWFGPRAGWLMIGAGLLAALQTTLLGAFSAQAYRYDSA